MPDVAIPAGGVIRLIEGCVYEQRAVTARDLISTACASRSNCQEDNGVRFHDGPESAFPTRQNYTSVRRMCVDLRRIPACRGPARVPWLAPWDWTAHGVTADLLNRPSLIGGRCPGYWQLAREFFEASHIVGHNTGRNGRQIVERHRCGSIDRTSARDRVGGQQQRGQC